MKTLFLYEEAIRKASVKNPGSIESDKILQECRNISERAVEVLTRWGGMQDIRLQIQFGAVIVGKIDKLKRNEHIRSNEVKKKICTLLRNVIRLNVADDVFSQEQIEVLKKGFLILSAEDVQKEDLLQLNRQLRKENLLTMPAWE